MKKTLIALASTAALLSSGGAMAQAYVGGGLGWAQIDADCEGLSCDDKDTGFKLYGGFKFHPNFAVEGTYFDYGQVKASSGPTSLNIEGTALGVGVAGFLDFTPSLTGVARLGFARNKLQGRVNGPGFSVSDDESKTKPYFGLALGYKVAPGLRVEAGLDFTTFESEDEEADARLVTVGVRYEF